MLYECLSPLLDCRKTTCILCVTVSSVPSSSSFLKKNRKSYPPLASASLAVWSLGKISRSFLITIIPSLYSLLPLPSPTHIKNKKPQASFQLPSWGVSRRWKNPRLKSRTGWLEGKGQGEREREKNERRLLPSHIFVSSYILWAFEKCFETY